MRQITAYLFDDKAQMAKAVAETIADAVLRYVAQTRAPMIIALAGGETPKPAYQHLAKMKLPWDKLMISATDERITADKTRRNETMLGDILGEQARITNLQENAKAPTLHLALLGAGADGHTASLFADAMPDDDETNIIKVSPPTMPEQRLTLPMTTFAAAPRLLLMITGSQKWQRLTAARQSDSPITKLLSTRKDIANPPAEVFHAPD